MHWPQCWTTRYWPLQARRRSLGTLTTTLDAAVLSAAGTETLSGALASTLDDSVLAGVGSETISGILAATLDDAALLAAGTVSAYAPAAPTPADRVYTVRADSRIEHVAAEPRTYQPQPEPRLLEVT